MSRWSVWDWIAYICLGIAAVGVVLTQLPKDVRAMIEGWSDVFASPKWSYVPAIFFVIATVVFIIRMLTLNAEKPSKVKIESQATHASPVSVPTHKIGFDYLPKNMLESGWVRAYPPDEVKPRATVEHDAPVQGSVTITAPAGHAYDYRLPRNAVLSNRIAFTAKYLDEDTMIFVRLDLRSEDGNEKRQKWVKILVGTRETSYPTPKWEDQECTLVVTGTPVDGWRRLELFLPDVTQKTWGKLGLIFEGITTIRLRASLKISPICLYEQPMPFIAEGGCEAVPA